MLCAAMQHIQCLCIRDDFTFLKQATMLHSINVTLRRQRVYKISASRLKDAAS